MSSRQAVEGFLAQKSLAVVGVSRAGNKFSNAAFRELAKKGYAVVPVNPHADSLEGQRCYHTLKEIQPRPGGALIITPPAQTEAAVRDAAEAGIRSLWIQQGAETPEALALAESRGLSVVSRECILMFAEPVGSLHRFHRWIWKLLGKLPK